MMQLVYSARRRCLLLALNVDCCETAICLDRRAADVPGTRSKRSPTTSRQGGVAAFFKIAFPKLSHSNGGHT
jgi:hypothetical protein